MPKNLSYKILPKKPLLGKSNSIIPSPDPKWKKEKKYQLVYIHNKKYVFFQFKKVLKAK